MPDYPVLPVIMPADIAKAQNGQIDAKLLRPIQSKGQLHRLAATAWNALQLAAFFDGIALNPISSPDTYRNLDQQTNLFMSRYQLAPSTRTPAVTRTYQGKTWYLKPGVAPAGSPGTSNHGWGLAVDVANANGRTLDWMLQNCVKYGFTWEVKNGANAEAWHIRYVCGDQPTTFILDAIKAFPQLDVR